MTDRALVFGIGRYLKLGARRTAINLNGPVLDATEMAEWLRSQGSHVTLVTSNGDGNSVWTVADLRPTLGDVEGPFNGVVGEAEDQFVNGRRVYLGRRLTIYMAGHGFTPDKKHLALITAEASNLQTMSIQATSWADWFAQQTTFDEVVLYMDCCAVDDYAQASRQPLGKAFARRARGFAKAVTIFAAPPDQWAYEQADQNGVIRGIFTRELLRGLKGDATDGNNQVTTSSLRRFFRGNGLTGSDDTPTGDLRLDPQFRDDDEIVLATIAARPQVTVHTGLPPSTVIKIEGPQGVAYDGPVDRAGEVRIPAMTGIYAVRTARESKYFEIGAGGSSDVYPR